MAVAAPLPAQDRTPQSTALATSFHREHKWQVMLTAFNTRTNAAIGHSVDRLYKKSLKISPFQIFLDFITYFFR